MSKQTTQPTQRCRHWRETARRFGVGTVAIASTVAMSGVGSINASSIDTSAFTTPASAASLAGPGDLRSDVAEVFIGVAPTRLLDTRAGIGVSIAGPLGPDEAITVEVVGVGGIPPQATSVALNTTFTAQSTSPSFMTIWPTGEERPYTAVNNASPGMASPNFVVAKLADRGSIDVYNERGDAHIVLDVAGYYVPLSEIENVHGGGELYSGEGAPGADVGEDGDFYVNEDTGLIYGPKTDGEWGEPITAPGSGTQGPALLTGNGAPATSKGVVDDMYLDLAAPAVYGPKTASGWGLPVEIGPDGTGTNFLVGSAVPNGTVGSDGDMYLDKNTLTLYGPKAGGAWVPSAELGDGTEFLTGLVPPAGGIGDNGDHYIDTVGLMIYGPKAGGVWPAGSPLGGAEILTGVIPPTGGDGDDGDTYINTVTWKIYGPKAGGVWPAGTDLGGGAEFFTGVLPPVPGVGDDGDMFIDTLGSKMYGPKAAGVWPAGIALGGGGAEFFTGVLPPVPGVGDDGDMYIDTLGSKMYGPKAAGVWPAGIALGGGGIGSSDGAFLSGAVAPTAVVGDDGDHYIDTVGLMLYGPKAGGVWPAGTDLDPGAGFLTGTVPPVDANGADGDVYIDTVALMIYGPKAGGVWPEGTDLNGSVLLSGVVPPVPGDGDNGDMYIDAVGLKMYGPKAGGVWPAGTDLNGSVMLSGVIPPTTEGDDGDMYIDTVGLKLYGPKASGVWGPGTDLNGSIMLTGIVPPTTEGDDGDMYFDTTNFYIYGPKVGGVWPAGSRLSGVPSAATDSALSAYSNGLGLTIALNGRKAIGFAQDGVKVGTAIERVDPDTFKFVTAGTYKVSYDVTVGLALLGSLQVEVAGAAVPGLLVDVGLLGSASQSVLVHAAAGNTLEIVLQGVVGLTGTVDSSLMVELIAAD